MTWDIFISNINANSHSTIWQRTPYCHNMNSQNTLYCQNKRRRNQQFLFTFMKLTAKSYSKCINEVKMLNKRGVMVN